MDADADIGLLEALEGEIGARLRMAGADAPGIKPVMEILEDTLANSVQMTEVKACLAESLPAEIGAVDEDVCGAFEGEDGAEEDGAGGDRGGDADGV